MPSTKALEKTKFLYLEADKILSQMAVGDRIKIMDLMNLLYKKMGGDSTTIYNMMGFYMEALANDSKFDIRRGSRGGIYRV